MDYKINCYSCDYNNQLTPILLKLNDWTQDVAIGKNGTTFIIVDLQLQNSAWNQRGFHWLYRLLAHFYKNKWHYKNMLRRQDMYSLCILLSIQSTVLFVYSYKCV